MKRLETQQALRNVRDLPFCYLCRNNFVSNDQTNYDHVPPESVFDPADRQPLKLRSHAKCNHSHHLTDEKNGQMIGLRRGAAPRPENRRLRALQTSLGPAVIDFDVDAAVWRWIAGFHAALYQQPLCFSPTGAADPRFRRSLILPFPKGSRITRTFDPIPPQHLRFVATIKANRFRKNLERIICNRGKLVYECVWDRYDDRDEWFCVFALNVCDWKDLGAITPRHARGCAGHYAIETNQPPPEATRAVKSPLVLPNYDRLDPFAP